MPTIARRQMNRDECDRHSLDQYQEYIFIGAADSVGQDKENTKAIYTRTHERVHGRRK